MAAVGGPQRDSAPATLALCACSRAHAGGDRGGVADLITTIKLSKVPIICICNDKYHQKLRSLRNHVRACRGVGCWVVEPPP
jgi:hypothetical protein